MVKRNRYQNQTYFEYTCVRIHKFISEKIKHDFQYDCTLKFNYGT